MSLNSDDLVHVNAYVKDDGTQVKEHYGGRVESFGSDGFINETEHPALTKILGGISVNVDPIPLPEPPSPGPVIEGGISIFVGLGKIVVEVLKVLGIATVVVGPAATAVVALAKGFGGSGAAAKTLETSIDAMKEVQSLSKSTMDKTLNNLVNAPNQQDYLKSLETYAKQNDLFLKNQNSISKIEFYSQTEDYKSMLEELENYKNNQKDVMDKLKPEIPAQPKPATFPNNVQNDYVKFQPREFEVYNPIGAQEPQILQNNISKFTDFQGLPSQNPQSAEVVLHARAEVNKNLCSLVDDVLNGREVKLPEGMEIIDKTWNKTSNFKAVAFKSGDEVTVCFAGTDKFSVKDWAANFKMGLDMPSTQMKDANKFFRELRYDDKYRNLTFRVAGHSEGGSETIYTALFNNVEGYTYNTFPVGKGIVKDIISQGGGMNGKVDFNLITNYRNPHDPVSKLFYEHIGKTYIVENQQNAFLANTPFGSIQAHGLDFMNNCETAIPIDVYKKANPYFIDSVRFVKFTGSDIDKIAKEGLFDIYEPEIMKRLQAGDIVPEDVAKRMVQDGLLKFIKAPGADNTNGYYTK